MKKLQSILIMAIMVLVLVGVAKADWNEGDPHKMHWPQLPDPFGWDVRASEPYVLADDWWCSETGYIKDIHFWGSWKQGYYPPWTTLYGFWISIHENIPASQNPNGNYSQPGTILLNNFYPIEAFIVASPFSGQQGWYDPIYGMWFDQDHFEYFQYNLFLPEEDWVWQEMETIYWLNISAVVNDPFTFPWGWKTTTHDLIFQDTSVWTDQFMYPDPWFPIYDPLIGAPEHLDLAFVITGEPEEPTNLSSRNRMPYSYNQLSYY
ncbi:MAG: hypothetical protein AMJ42_03035 [Deltaproteobacteria bacterium DG_8]|nr:MAG: hypothetical protein AMJ42_03035 [Deltaproteobacteria bacterium DG_8]